MLVAHTNDGRWEVRTLIEDHNCIQSREIKACISRFLLDHVIKTLSTNPGIPVRAIQDQMQKQFDVGVLKMKAFRANRIVTNKMTGRLIYKKEPYPDSPTRTFRRVYVCLGSPKQGFRAYGIEILGLDGCFMPDPWTSQILTSVGVDPNNRIYPVAYAIVEVESKASWCWFLNLLGEDLGTVLARATTVVEFNKKTGRAKCDLLLNNIYEVFNKQLVDGRDQPIITCLKYILEYLMKMIVVVHKVIAKTVRPLTPYVTALFDGKAAGVRVVQVKLVVLVKLLVQGMPQVKLLVLVNLVQHQAQQLVQGMPQVKLLVLVNLVQHQAQQAKYQVNIVQDQLKHIRDLGKVFRHQD
ncbi:mutator type transposase [Tanacetum coccineum]